MKALPLFAIALLWAVTSLAEPPVASTPAGVSPAATKKEPVNYLISVQWKDTKEVSNFFQLLTTEGSFNLNTLQHGKPKGTAPDMPVTLRLSGTLEVLSAEKGRLKLFLGRTVPYATGNSAGSYQQIQEGLDSTFIVTFGKPLVIQGDQNGQVSIVVKQQED